MLVAAIDELGLGLLGVIGAVGPHVRGGVGGIEYVVEHLAVVDGGIGDGIAADDLVRAVDVDVVLVAEIGAPTLLGPARIVRLRSLGPMALARSPFCASLAGLFCQSSGVSPALT